MKKLASAVALSIAVLSLSACGNRDAIEPLARALKDEDPIVARAALVAVLGFFQGFLRLRRLAWRDEQIVQRPLGFDQVSLGEDEAARPDASGQLIIARAGDRDGAGRSEHLRHAPA